jgi:hypothetical protein
LDTRFDLGGHLLSRSVPVIQKGRDLRFFATIVLFIGICFGTQAIYAQEIDSGDLYLVHTLFVDKVGSSLQSSRFRALVRKKLSANGFVITDDRKSADAVLKGSLSISIERKWGDQFLVTEAALHLRSKRGEELWHATYSTGRNLNLPRTDFVQELTDHVARSLHEAWEGSLSASNDGRVEHVFLVWTPADTQLMLANSGRKSDVTAEELSKLKALGVKGQLRVAHTGIEGSGSSKTRVLIVMQHQVANGPADFSLSRESLILIIQMGDGWVTEPSPLPFSKSKLRVLPITFNQTGFTLDRENAGIQFQFAFTWPKE